MPEFKHSFTTGKMNKDVDERLVANGEYRDAMNIQIRTTDGGSDGIGEGGTVQNLQGNTIVGWPNSIATGERIQVIGSVADEKKDVAYFLISSSTFSTAEVYDSTNYTSVDNVINGQFNGIIRWVDSIVEQHTNGTMTYVLVDNFCVAGHFNDIE